MNNHFPKVALRFAAAASLLVGISVVACSSSTEDPPLTPKPPGGGAPPAATGGSGGSSPTTGGTGPATGGMSAGGAASACTPACAKGQPCTMGTCGPCPGYAPELCAEAKACANFTKDADFCGNCTTKCGETQACSASACQPALMPVGVEFPSCGKLQLLADTAKLYVLNTGAGELSTFDGATGALTSVATGLTGASAFAVDATNAYVVAGMKVIKVTLADKSKVDFATETMPIYDVALDATSVYWATDKPAADTDVAHMDFSGFIKKAAKATAPATGAIVGGGMDMGQPMGVAVSGVNVLYASSSAQNVELQKGLPVGAVPHDDPNHVKLGASQGSLIFGHRSVQIDAAGMYVYWVNGTLQRTAFTMAAPTQETAANSIGNITAFAITPTSAYFTSDGGDGKEAFEKATLKAETSTWIARNLAPVSSIITDATSVYLASGCYILKTAL